MTPLRRGALLASLLLLSLSANAQFPFFSDAVPLTDTRYGAFGAEPRLVSNGQDFLLFWATGTTLRVTRLVDGQKRAGRPVLDVENAWFDVTWTGTQFLVAAYEWRPGTIQGIRARIVSANGEVLGEPFTIVSGAGRPRLAFDGSRVLMVYAADGDLRSLLLRPEGVPATDPHHQTIAVAAGNAPETSVAAGGPGFAALTALTDRIRITTFHSNGDIAGSLDAPRSGLSTRRVATAGNGQEVFAVWTNGNGVVEFVKVAANGTIGPATPIPGTEGAVAAAVAWDGSRWMVTTIGAGRMRTHSIDATGIPQPLPTATAQGASPVTLASARGRTWAAWRGPGDGASLLARDVAATGEGQPVAFSAAEQTLQTTTASHDAALVVWSELRDGKRTLHAGLRNSTGGWLENKIGGDEEAPLAASDGNLFLVIKKTGTGWYALTLDTEAKIAASTPAMTVFTPTGIASDGLGWVIIGTSEQSNIYAVRVMPWGSMSAPVLIAEHQGTRKLENPRIASGGGGFLAVWQDSGTISCAPPCDGYESLLHGARLTDTLTRIDAQSLEIAPHSATSPDLYFDGVRFVIFWLDAGAVETRTVRVNAAGSGITRVSGAQVDTGRIRVRDTPFGAAIHADDGEVLIVKDGVASRYGLGTAESSDAVVTLGPDIFYIQARSPDEEPYHGARHLFLHVGSVAPRGSIPPPPEIVRAVFTDEGNLIAVDWKAPPDPINGYRIEYRVDDGLWNELDHWFDRTATEMSIKPWLDHVRYQFRIRAWSDAGVSEYSRAQTARLLGRRRSVR